MSLAHYLSLIHYAEAHRWGALWEAAFFEQFKEPVPIPYVLVCGPEREA